MIKRHTSRTLFTHVCDNLPPEYAEKIGAHTLLRTSAPKWQKFVITPELSKAIHPLITQMGISDELTMDSTSLWHTRVNLLVYLQDILEIVEFNSTRTAPQVLEQLFTYCVSHHKQTLYL